MTNNIINHGFSFVYWLLYHPFAWTYDVVAYLVSAGRWQDWVHTILSYIQGVNVLEIGPGTGHLLLSLKLSGYQATGLDESQAMLRIIKRKKSSENRNFLLIRGIAETSPLSPKCMDTIIATFPSAFIFVPKTISEMYRVLKPGGRLAILFSIWPSRKKPVNFLSVL